MTIREGTFLFIQQSFFDDFPNSNLSINKVQADGSVRHRPCFFAFRDAESGLLWCVPISSKVEKYRSIREQKLQRNGRCDTIIIGSMFGRESAFLIQNMFPTEERYLDGIYLDAYNNPVMTDQALTRLITSSARRVLALTRQGKRLTFTDILFIEKQLLR